MLENEVANLLADYGTDLTLTRLNGSVYNPATGSMSAGTTATFTIRGVFINYREEQIDNTSIRASDRKLLIQGKGLLTTPQIKDRVSGVEIIDVRRIQAGNTVIAYACQTRG